MLDHKGGHEVGRAEVPRLSFEAAHAKVEVVANGQAHAYLPTYLPTYLPNKVGVVPFRGRGSLTTTKLEGGGLCATHQFLQQKLK